MSMRFAVAAGLACVLAACEDPARPVPPDVNASSLFVDSDPQGGRILIDGQDTGERTPALIASLGEGARNVIIELDTADLTYRYADIVVVSPQLENQLVEGPLTIRCTNPQCLRLAAEFHAAGDLGFVVNAAGPLFTFEGLDRGITWPIGTPNSYAPRSMATMTALVDGEEVALGLRNAGDLPNYWAGRPLPTIVSTDPYRVTVPAWITPPTPTTNTVLRGIEVVQEVTVEEDLPNVLQVRVTWTNISADSLYRSLDSSSPAVGITYTEAWLGFILDADVGAIAESDDDLVSYSADRALVFAYDSDFEVTGFTNGWSDEPGLIGLMLIEGPGTLPRLNAWPRARDFVAGASDETGRVLLTATQNDPPNHVDTRIGYAPDEDDGDYILSVATGPVDLAPGQSVSARFAVLLARPAAGTFTSGALHPAGDPNDLTRALAATAAPLFALADSVINAPAAVPER